MPRLPRPRLRGVRGSRAWRLRQPHPGADLRSLRRRRHARSGHPGGRAGRRRRPRGASARPRGLFRRKRAGRYVGAARSGLANGLRRGRRRAHRRARAAADRADRAGRSGRRSGGWRLRWRGGLHPQPVLAPRQAAREPALLRCRARLPARGTAAHRARWRGSAGQHRTARRARRRRCPDAGRERRPPRPLGRGHDLVALLRTGRGGRSGGGRGAAGPLRPVAGQ